MAKKIVFSGLFSSRLSINGSQARVAEPSPLRVPEQTFAIWLSDNKPLANLKRFRELNGYDLINFI